jgi:hypothetical protein
MSQAMPSRAPQVNWGTHWIVDLGCRRMSQTLSDSRIRFFVSHRPTLLQIRLSPGRLPALNGLGGPSVRDAATSCDPLARSLKKMWKHA